MTNVVVIIQARLTSKRLPRKILRKINGKTILEHCVDRASLAKNVHSVIQICGKKCLVNIVNAFFTDSLHHKEY